jgi:hypothetical protein
MGELEPSQIPDPSAARASAVKMAITVDIGTSLVRATTALLHAQLVTGEIPTYRRIGALGLLYTPSPYMSAIVLDALTPFDPVSPAFHSSTLAALSTAERRTVERAVTLLRARTCSFLAWQEEVDGTWCFYGRGSGLGADAATTACAALALASARRRGGERRWQKHVRALAMFKTTRGPYATFLPRRSQRAAGEDAAVSRHSTTIDRMVNAYVMRALATAGVADESLAGFLLDEVEHGDRERGSPEVPDPVCFAHAAARAWAAAPRADADRVSAALVPWLLSRQRPDGGFGGALSTACATTALIDLGYLGDGLDRAAQFLLATISAGGEWAYEPHLVGGHGSASFTTALALSALGAYTNARGDAR